MKPMRQFLLIAFVSLGCLFRTAPIQAQTADEVEKSIANLPSAQRAWERFRFWIGRLPITARLPPGQARR